MKRRHLDDKPKQPNQILECDICHQTFHGATGLKLHKYAIHMNIKFKRERCKFCREYFATKSELKVHTDDHHEEDHHHQTQDVYEQS